MTVMHEQNITQCYVLKMYLVLDWLHIFNYCAAPWCTITLLYYIKGSFIIQEAYLTNITSDMKINCMNQNWKYLLERLGWSLFLRDGVQRWHDWAEHFVCDGPEHLIGGFHFNPHFLVWQSLLWCDLIRQLTRNKVKQQW